MRSSIIKNINSYRKFVLNNANWNKDGDFVVYWMQANRRLEYNFALEYAVAMANNLQKPLLIYEGLNVDYPWACERFHHFILQGIREHHQHFTNNLVKGVRYVPYVELEKGHAKGLIYALAENACGIISDEFPVFIIRKHNEKVAGKISVPYITIDSNGIIPLGITEKDPYSAYLFRKIMQKHVIEALKYPPVKEPLLNLKNWGQCTLPENFKARYVFDKNLLNNLDTLINTLPINHKIKKVEKIGTRVSALEIMNHFVEFKLARYEEDRNHPDRQGGSGLSPWLHFGKISSYEIVDKVLSKQPNGWDIEESVPNGGKNSGFFRGHSYVESFLDELITWREIGFQFAHHRRDYDHFDSLPDWAKKTMNKHDQDPREYVYSLEELAESKTHDKIWNAAQTELRTQGIMHNYLRMLWGKKILEWTSSHKIALDVLIELNNRYALDGRDPNSYSGIFWCLGRFDRAWQERAIFGKIRYMSSQSTSKKIKLKQYIATYNL